MKKIFIFSIIAIFLIGTLGFFLLQKPTQETEDTIEYPVLVQTEKGMIEKNYDIKQKKIILKEATGNKSQIADYTLTLVDSSVIDAWAEGTAILYKETELFNAIKFKDIKNQIKNLRDVQFFIWVNESYQVEIPDYKQECTTKTEINGTQQVCNNVQIGSHNETRYKEYWKPYITNQKLPAGEYKWRLEAKRDRPNQAIDFILTGQNIDFDEWAWWDNNWERKKPINISTSEITWNNYTVLIPVTYDADMISNFSDVRFTDGSETLELGVWLQNKTNGVSANFWVNTSLTQSTNTTIYMYYGNPSATTSTSNRNDVFTEYNALGISITTASSTETAKLGMQLEATTNIIISSINKTASETTTTRGLLVNGSHGAYNTGFITNGSDIWATGTFVNTKADLTQPYTLNTGTEFWLATDNSGGSKTSYAGDGNSYPYVQNGANWEAAVNWNENIRTDQATGWIFSIEGFYFTRNANPTIYFGAEEQNADILLTLISPENNTIFTINTVDFSANAIATATISVSNVSLLIDGVINETNTSGISGIYNFSKTLSDGDHNYTFIAVGNDSIQYNASNGTLLFSVDTIFPTINISHPLNGTNFDYLVSLNNLTLNVTVTETNLDACWYDYNNTNTTFSCSTGVLSQNNLTLTNQSIVRVYANDTAGNLNSSISDWTFSVFDFNNYTSDSSITEASSTTFIGNFQTGSSISETFLEYNNTNNSVSITSLGGNRYTLISTVTSPAVSSDTNITWFFWINNVNTTQFNQTVLNVNLDNCGSFSNAILYYYLEDELTQELINNSNSTIESLVILRTLEGSNIAQFNQTFSGNSTPQICSETNLTSSDLGLWEQSRYGSTNYVFEQHNVQNASMTSPANFTLLDLPSDSATTFRITYKSSTFLPVPDAVIDVQRKYIGEGAFKSVESPITDANGEVSASLDLDAVIYRIIVRQNGTTLSTFENPAVSCQNILTGDCNINLNERQTINLINNYDIINDFNYGLTQDNRTITLTFEIPSGIPRTINLYVNQSTILGNNTACNQTLLATSGQVQCTIDPTLGDVFATARVSADNTLITTASTTILEDRSQYFGTDNIVLTFFLVLSLVLLFVSDPIAVLIGIVIGLITSGLMLFLNVGSLFGVTSVLMYLIIVIIILIIKISNRQR